MSAKHSFCSILGDGWVANLVALLAVVGFAWLALKGYHHVASHISAALDLGGAR